MEKRIVSSCTALGLRKQITIRPMMKDEFYKKMKDQFDKGDYVWYLGLLDSTEIWVDSMRKYGTL